MLLQALQRLDAARLHARALCDEIGPASGSDRTFLLLGRRLRKNDPGGKASRTEGSKRR
ncbi:hypothetical protein FHX15_006326 [Rhizobium sp. BK650]|nr:hypothetical protein [Rhizobium sp. BK650]